MADFGTSFVQGFMAAQANKRAKETQAMQMQTHAVQMQEAQIKLRGLRDEENWQHGRMAAAKEGGMEGVIKYSENTRPEEGIKLRSAQADYEKSILSGKYIAAQTAGTEQDTKIKGYEAAGNMYGQLQQMYARDPKLAQDAYTKNIEMVKDMDPDAPAEYSPDRASLAIGMAVPQSMIFKAKEEGKKLQTETAQNYHDREQLLAQGNTLGVQALDGKIKDNQDKQIKTQRQVQELDLKIAKVPKDREDELRKEYTSVTKNYAVMGETMQKMEGLVQSDDILTNPAKQMSLVNQYARMNSPGIVTELNEKDAAKSSLLSRLYQMQEQVRSGSPLTPEAVKNITGAMRSQWEGAQPYIKDNDDYYTKLATQSGVDPKNVIPSTFVSINKQSDQGKLISRIKDKQPGFSVSKFIETNVEANPELGDYLKEHPEYKTEMLQKYHERLTNPVADEEGN